MATRQARARGKGKVEMGRRPSVHRATISRGPTRCFRAARGAHLQQSSQRQSSCESGEPLSTSNVMHALTLGVFHAECAGRALSGRSGQAAWGVFRPHDPAVLPHNAMPTATRQNSIYGWHNSHFSELSNLFRQIHPTTTRKITRGSKRHALNGTAHAHQSKMGPIFLFKLSKRLHYGHRPRQLLRHPHGGVGLGQPGHTG